MEFDAREQDPLETYKIMKTVVVPRPIAWISSIDSEGRDNLAPYSFFNCVAKRVVMFSSGTNDDGIPKDTARNALETGEFVVNLATPELFDRMDETSAPLSPGESEFDATGLDRAPSAVVAPPRVAQSPVSVECVLYDSMHVHEAVLVLGEVVYLHVDDELYVDGRVDAHHVDTVGRLGGPFYTDVDVLDRTRKYPNE